jgi:hypothetical protein
MPYRAAATFAAAMGNFWIRNGIASLLGALHDAYQLPLNSLALCRLIEEGPMEIKKTIGLPKYICGMRTDGSIRRVRIE